MKMLIAVGMGGFVGAVCRYYVAGWIGAMVPGRFPWGILVANVVGCFLIGVLMGNGEGGVVANRAWRLFLVTGFLGALTTFSTFGLDTVVLARGGGAAGLAIANVGLNVVLGLTAVVAGMGVSGMIFKGGTGV